MTIRKVVQLVQRRKITDAFNEISFVHSRMQAGSRANHLMQANAYTEPQEEEGYDWFRANSVDTFGPNVKKHFVK